MRRRDFLLDSLALAGLASATRTAFGRSPNAASAAARVRFGYAAITWGGNDLEAINDISALGFAGIQLRDSAFARWGDNPSDLKTRLASHKLTFVALSSGSVSLDPAKQEANLALHLSHARFAQQTGALYLQVTDERPAGRRPGADDYRRMGRLLTELGRRTADLGVPLSLHPHMGALSQAPLEVDQVLEATDPRFVKLELDIAHYQQAGGNPVDAIRKYADRLLFLHIKDVESPIPGGKAGSYRFVELGRGKVDVKAVFAALAAIRFDGWAIVELDEVPDKARSPKESAEISKKYLGAIGQAVTG